MTTPLSSPDRPPPAGTFPPAGVRAVAFDAVGTLVEPWPPVGEAYAAAGVRHGVALDAASAGARFREAWRRQEMADAAAVPAFATSRQRERARWRAIVGDVFGETAVTAAIFSDLWNHFGRPEAWRSLPAGADLVRAAADAGCVVALASNFDERLLAIAPHVEPLSRIEHVFASSELGWRKPAAEFFRRVEQLLGVGPDELLLVGDDPDLDVAAARAAGWRSIRVA
ncbi:MAG: HAD-IA family hydrolase [Planctomycetaceae bacterium]